MNKLFLGDNYDIMTWLLSYDLEVDLIYADMMYDDMDFDWLVLCKALLKDTGSIFVQTDYRSVAELKVYMDSFFGKENFINWIIWPYDWGGRPKRAFGRKHDDILWYSKTKKYKFYPERVTIPKKTTGSGFNPSGRTTKVPTDVWEDIGNFHTMSKERIKDKNGKNIRWQKPLRLLDRIILATTDEDDIVLDPFLGTGTTGKSAINNGRQFIGIEYDKAIYDVASTRLGTMQ